MSLSEVTSLVGGVLMGRDAKFDYLQVDSREIKGGELFCAVRGERADGHDYVSSAMRGGAAGAIVEHDPRPAPKERVGSNSEDEDVMRRGWERLLDDEYRPVVVVPSVVGAMAAIALHFRRMLKGPVIGVTGSAGKTTVKEMIAATMSPIGAVLKSEGNLNTEYGVPMTWSRLEPKHRAAVIEMAMRGPGQIAHLARMSRPDVGVITSVGSAHIGELGSRDAIAAAKSELLEALPTRGLAVIPSDSDYTDFLRETAPCNVVTFGEGGDYRVLEWRQAGDSVEFAIATPTQEVAGAVPGVGAIQARNAAVSIAAAEAAGVDARLASGALKGVKFPGKRMEILQRNGVTVWLDAYNSSPESCEIALHSFADLKVPGRKFAILGDMLELGEFSESEHRRIGEVAAGVGLFELALVGELAEHIGAGARDAGFNGETSFHPDAEAASAVLERTGSGDAVLIKGSRGIGLERVLETPDA